MSVSDIEEQWQNIDRMYGELEILCHNEGHDKTPLLAMFATPTAGKNMISIMQVKEDCSEAFFLLGIMGYVDKGQIRSKLFDDAYYQYRAYLASYPSHIRLKEDDEQYAEQLPKIKAKLEELQQYCNEVQWPKAYFAAIEIYDDETSTTSMMCITNYQLFSGYPAFNIVTCDCGVGLQETIDLLKDSNLSNLEAIEEEIAYLEGNQ